MSRIRHLYIQGLIGVLAVVSVSYGRPHNMPDNIQRLHGLPLTWGIHQIATITGPVDFWIIRILYLIIDMFFWLFLVIFTPILYERVTVVSCEICLNKRE
jgi:hypothetical protein